MKRRSIVAFVVFIPTAFFLPQLQLAAAMNAGIFDFYIPKMKFNRSFSPQSTNVQPFWLQKLPFSSAMTSYPLNIERRNGATYPPVAFIATPSIQRWHVLSKKLPAGKSFGRTSVLPVKCLSQLSTVATSATRLYHSTPQRNFFSNQNKKKPDDDDNSFLGQVKSVAKKFLPASWFQSGEERRQKNEMKRVEKEIKSEIQQVFKDFPLPIRMMGNMIAPIFGGLMSSLAETAASQQSMVNVVYDQAVRSIQSDASVRQALGDTISVGRPFSQSSSTSSINGVTTARVELAFAVSGSRGEGMARLQASGSGNKNPTIQFLEVQANGRRIDVNTIAYSSPKTSQFSSGYNGDDNIIDAEIIEKEVKK
jgi:Cytochrome oxidase complex assembly protein 1